MQSGLLKRPFLSPCGGEGEGRAADRHKLGLVRPVPFAEWCIMKAEHQRRVGAQDGHPTEKSKRVTTITHLSWRSPARPCASSSPRRASPTGTATGSARRGPSRAPSGSPTTRRSGRSATSSSRSQQAINVYTW